MANVAILCQLVIAMKECAGPVEVQSLSRTASVSFWSKLAARVRSWFEVPYGYQDENGFHYGPEPVPDWALRSPLLQQAGEGKRASVFIDRACQAMQHPVELPADSVAQPTEERTPHALVK